LRFDLAALDERLFLWTPHRPQLGERRDVLLHTPASDPCRCSLTVARV